MDWFHLAQDRDQWRVLVNTVMNLRFPYSVAKILSSCATGGFSRRAQLHGVSDIVHCRIPVFSATKRSVQPDSAHQ
jgi:hypothetical protein